MPLLKGGEIIDDGWLRLGDDDSIPQGADVIVSFDRLAKGFEALKRHEGRLGVAFPNHGAVDDLVPYLGALHLVVLEFPAFGDGRAYSQAIQIRRHLEFGGELRAAGAVLPDQVAYMRQCGFDAFEVTERHGLDVWQRAATAITLTYQRGYAPERGFAPAEIGRTRLEQRS
jgi:uncharacterized protein (DUF934 family)